MAWKKLATAEIALAKRWHLEEGLSAAKTAERLGRAPSTISRLVIKKVVHKRQGRNILLSPAIVDKLEAKLEAMIDLFLASVRFSVEWQCESGAVWFRIQVGKHSWVSFLAECSSEQCPYSARTVPVQFPIVKI